jgi:hypothetical protein
MLKCLTGIQNHTADFGLSRVVENTEIVPFSLGLEEVNNLL